MIRSWPVCWALGGALVLGITFRDHIDLRPSVPGVKCRVHGSTLKKDDPLVYQPMPGGPIFLKAAESFPNCGIEATADVVDDEWISNCRKCELEYASWREAQAAAP